MNPWESRFASRIFRALLCLCPRDLRSNRDPGEFFDEMLAEEFARSGRVGAGRFCLLSYMDVLATAAARWCRLLAARRARLSKRLTGSGRDGRMRNWIASIRADLGVGVRSLRKTPTTTTIAVATVAISIALTTLVFSAIQGALLRPPPFRDGERVMAVDWIDADFEASDFTYFRSRQSAFERVDGYFRARVTVEGLAEYPESLPAAVVTASSLDHLGVPPSLGALFPEGEGETRAVEHVVVGFGIWQSRFGGSNDVLGRRITVEGNELEIVGVMPDGFAFPVSESIWIPMDLTYGSGPGSGRSFSAFGRLSEGRSPADAEVEATAIAEEIGAQNILSTPPTGATVEPFARRHLPPGIQTPLYLMLATVVLVLLVACANLANLLVARSLVRRGEVALRGALGAGQGRLAQQFLVEAALVSGAGTVIGLMGAAQSVGMLNRAVVDVQLPYWVEFRVDGAVLVFTTLLMVTVALAAGAWPAVSAARCRIAAVLRSGGRGSTGGLGRTGSALVAGQISLSLALLIGAGLLIKSVTALGALDFGYDADNVLTAQISVPPQAAPNAGDFFLTLVSELEALPGIEQAALTRNAPGTGETFAWDVWIEGEERGSAPNAPAADGKNIGHGYFEALGMEIFEGRDFTADEARFDPAADGPYLVIVNRTFAQRHLGPSAVGRRVQFGARDPEAPWFTVIGVVADGYVGSRSGGIGLPASPQRQMYIPWGLVPYRSGTLLLRTRSTPEAVLPEVRTLLAEIAPGVPLIDPAPLTDRIRESTWAFALFGSVFSAFGLVALIMSAGGLYGVIAFEAAQRRRELGMRMVLGASPVGIIGLSVQDGARKILVGVLAGAALALFFAANLRSLVFGVDTRDPLVYATAIGLVCVTGLLACLVPALAVSRLDPLTALRQD
jgi:predicted permease